MRASYDTLHQEFEGKPSRYSSQRPAVNTTDIDDAIPEAHPLDIPPYLDRRKQQDGFMMWGIAAE